MSNLLGPWSQRLWRLFRIATQCVWVQIFLGTGFILLNRFEVVGEIRLVDLFLTMWDKYLLVAEQSLFFASSGLFVV